MNDVSANPGGTFTEQGVYVLFGRETWPDSLDLIEDADVVLGGFETDLPISVASGGNLNGDAFDDLIVSVGGNNPTVQIFNGRTDWSNSAELYSADFRFANEAEPRPTPTSDADLRFFDALVALPNDVLNGLDDFTVEFSYKTTDTTDGFVLTGAGANSTNEVLVGFLNSTTMDIWVNGGLYQFTDLSDIADDQWHNYSIVRDTGNLELSLYIDDVLVETQSLQATHAATLVIDPVGLYLGQDQDAIGGDFNFNQALSGRLDAFRVWQKALTEAEVIESFGDVLTGNEAELRALYRFNEIGGDIVEDATANAYDGVFEPRPGAINDSTLAPQRVFEEFVSLEFNTDFALTNERANDSGHSAEYSLKYTPNGSESGDLDAPIDFDLSNAAQAELTFNYFLDNTGYEDVDEFRIKIREEGGDNITRTVATSFGIASGAESLSEYAETLVNGTGVWQQATINLQEFLGRSNLSLTIEFNNDTGIPTPVGAYEGFYIDDIFVKRRAEHFSGRNTRSAAVARIGV